jgi:hypothetical protein
LSRSMSRFGISAGRPGQATVRGIAPAVGRAGPASYQRSGVATLRIAADDLSWRERHLFAAAKEKAHVQESLICIGSNMRINYNAH